jgi:hypothetical protein
MHVISLGELIVDIFPTELGKKQSEVGEVLLAQP